MPRLFSFLLLVSLVFASTAAAQSDLFEKAPPGVEDALRARVEGFYKLWSEGKFREAEKFVAQDSQEAYYQMEKQKYEECKIIRWRFEEEFAKAVVTVQCKGKWNIQGNEMNTGMAMTRVWKTEKGDWYWTVSMPAKMETPFGISGVTNTPYGGIPGSAGMFNESGIPKDIKGLGAKIMGQVAPDKNSIKLSSFEKAKDVIKVHNGLTGPVTVRVDPDSLPKELTAVWDRTVIPAQSDATLTVSYTPPDKSPKGSGTLRISVDPLNQIFPISVTFAIPPEMEKIIQKSRDGK